MGLIRLRPRPASAPPVHELEPEPDVEPVEPISLSEPARDAELPALTSVPTPLVESVTPAAAEQRSTTRVIALANQKGGVAKTTTTLNLGVAFREMGHRVLLVDLDPQGNLTMSQGMNPDVIEKSMFDVLVHRIPISNVIESVEVDLAVSSIDLAGAELALSSLIGRERALETRKHERWSH